MRILVLGKDGQVGWELQQSLAPLGEVTALDRTELDLCDADAIRRVIRSLEPRVLVNAAAYTQVDKAETEPDLAMAVNGRAPGILAEEAKRLNALLIHYSTDYVFDGTKASPYSEDDKPNPLNVYGWTKLTGERAVQAAGGHHVILRTSWVYGLRGKNFLLTMLRLAGERDEIRVVDDQVGAPTSSRAIAEATRWVLEARLRPGGNKDRTRDGALHLTAAGHTSWFGFAQAILAGTEDQRVRAPVLTPVRTSEYCTPARRPLNSRLSNDKLGAVFAVRLASWDVELKRALETSRL